MPSKMSSQSRVKIKSHNLDNPPLAIVSLRGRTFPWSDLSDHSLPECLEILHKRLYLLLPFALARHPSLVRIEPLFTLLVPLNQ